MGEKVKIITDNDGICLMILVNLGQRSYNLRTTFPKYTAAFLSYSDKEHCPRGTS